MPETSSPRVALTIAGSDSGGGAGIQADIKAMQAHGVFAASVVTAVTAQNTRAVVGAHDLPPAFVAEQIDAVVSDIEVHAFKTGMLSSTAIIEVVAAKVEEHGLHPLVVDPVMISKSGFKLLKDEAIDTVRRRLLPLATVLTPNVHEAEHLTGLTIHTADDAREAARALHDLGAAAVLVKGGHLDGETEAVDVLFDGREMHAFRAERLDTPHTHGTGCTYASAIAANLARSMTLPTAVERAKRYVTEAIRHGLPLGGGHGPTHHYYFVRGLNLFPLDAV